MGLFKKWQPKKKIGKVVKAVTIGALTVGATAAGVGAVAGAIGGGGIMAGAIRGVGTVLKGGKTVGSKLSGAATKLVTGQTKEEQAVIKQAKQEAKDELRISNAVTKIMETGKTENEARAMLGLPALGTGDIEVATNSFFDSLTGGAKKVENSDSGTGKMNENALIYGGLGLLALLFLPKLMKS